MLLGAGAALYRQWWQGETHKFFREVFQPVLQARIFFLRIGDIARVCAAFLF